MASPLSTAVPLSWPCLFRRLLHRFGALCEPDRPLKRHKTFCHHPELVIRQWRQQSVDSLMGRRRPLRGTTRPQRREVESDEAAVMRVALFADNPLVGEAAHQHRYPTLGQPRQPCDLVEGSSRMLRDLPEHGKARASHRKRQAMISGQLDILPTELSLHAAQQCEDALLSLRAARPTAGVNRRVCCKRNVHPKTVLPPNGDRQGTIVPRRSARSRWHRPAQPTTSATPEER